MTARAQVVSQRGFGFGARMRIFRGIIGYTAANPIPMADSLVLASITLLTDVRIDMVLLTAVELTMGTFTAPVITMDTLAPAETTITSAPPVVSLVAMVAPVTTSTASGPPTDSKDASGAPAVYDESAAVANTLTTLTDIDETKGD